jgi:S1-C subfamily serine protease
MYGNDREGHAPVGRGYQGYPQQQEPYPPRYAPARRRAPRREVRRRGRGRIALTAFTAGVVGAVLVLMLMPALFGVNPLDIVRGKLGKVVVKETSGGTKTVTVSSPSGGAMSVTEISKAVIPSIVNIDIRTAPQRTPFFTIDGQEGTGSGVIYRQDGYIITNNHVVEGAQEITVTLASGEELAGTVVGTDSQNDIAVVKVDRTGLPAIALGNSDDLAVGQLVVAIGSPFGFEQTVTSGIVSALDRSVSAGGSQTVQAEVLSGLIQTDAAINPGNSGGALCDGSARLIGINAVIASSSGGSEGIGFAIPINKVRSVADSLIGGQPVQG